MKLSVLDQSAVSAGSTAAEAIRRSVELSQYVDRLGFHRYWVAEHHGTDTLAGMAPEILVTRIARETQHIRVGSGGVLLMHYTPLKVAETFAMIHALYPGRIDLGVGRSPGGSRRKTQMLKPTATPATPDLTDRLLELRSLFEPREGNVVGDLIAATGARAPRIWMLGSSPASARAAAERGFPYAYAHFLRPDEARESASAYLRHFRPSATEPEPTLLIAVSAVCADSRSEAEALALSARVVQRRMRLDQTGPVPAIAEARAELEAAGALPAIDTRHPGFIGTGPELRNAFHELSQALGADEIMVNTVVHSHEARLRSYELLAQHVHPGRL